MVGSKVLLSTLFVNPLYTTAIGDIIRQGTYRNGGVASEHRLVP